MDYSFYLKTNRPDYEKLRVYGFHQEENIYAFRKDLSEPDLYALFSITDEHIDVRVIDKVYEDDYLPFCVKDHPSSVRAEVKMLLEQIVSECFICTNPLTHIMEHMESTYGTKHEEPWDYLPGYYTFKAPNSGKWYAIIMHLPQNRIGLEGEQTIDIINVKIRMDKIDALIDHIHYFPSYHMNKKSWITILLDKDTDLEALKALIEDSFQMVEKPKKAQRQWLIPANPKYYDIDKAISESPDCFIWKQSNSIKPGDIVYLYIAAPVSGIVYQCEVLRTDIPYNYADENVRMAAVMELKMLRKYDVPISFAVLKKHGVNAVRGPRGIPASLLKEIENYGK